MITEKESQQWQIEEWARQEAYDLEMAKLRPWIIDEISNPTKERLEISENYKKAKKTKVKRNFKGKNFNLCGDTTKWLKLHDIINTPKGNQKETSIWIKKTFGSCGLKYALKQAKNFDQLVEILEGQADQIVMQDIEGSIFTY